MQFPLEGSLLLILFYLFLLKVRILHYRLYFRYDRKVSAGFNCIGALQLRYLILQEVRQFFLGLLLYVAQIGYVCAIGGDGLSSVRLPSRGKDSALDVNKHGLGHSLFDDDRLVFGEVLFEGFG